MRIQARKPNDAMLISQGEYAERRLDMALARMPQRIGNVSVRLDKEGKSYRCRILVELRNSGIAREIPARGERVAKRGVSHRLLTVEAMSEDAFEATDLAVERVVSRIVREFERSRERTSERVVARLADQPPSQNELELAG
jgi:ribosome-associated translation inhibitor RaiA